MARFDSFVAASTRAVFLAALAAVLTGCGDARFGGELSARPKPRPVSSADGARISLPEAEAFSIALPSANKQPGLGGTAEADAGAAGTGTAEATAAVSHSGTATGAFQLGHGFENDTERQVDFQFTVRFHYALEASATPASGYPDAQVGLKLYARGSRGRLLREMSLVEHSTDHGAAGRESDETLRFTLVLEPGEAVNVFLAGQVHVEIREGRSASGSLKLHDVRMEVVTKPWPAVQSEGNEQ